MAKGLDLETVIRGLHSSEIRIGFQTFRGGMTVWVSDRLHRVRAERVFDKANPLTIEDVVAQWMHSSTRRLCECFQTVTMQSNIGKGHQ